MSPTVVNQWAPASFAQLSGWSDTPSPALQSLVCALTPANSVGGGSGTPTAGNWLFCSIGWNQQAGTTPVTVGSADDIHSWWRPEQPSSASGMTRTTIWYTPNIARTVGYVYVAPNGCLDGLSMLVTEVSGLGPWDTVAGYITNYGNAVTSLGLSLAVPSQPSFVIGSVCGDNTGAGQAFAPSGWTALHTVSGSNGADHTCDTYLTSAYLASTSSAQSVSASASSSTDLSGAVLAVYTTGTAPPASTNPSSPYTVYEMASGSGFGTPPDQQTWVNITKRVWLWKEEATGILYQQGQVESTDGAIWLDNRDGAFTPSNPGSPYYSDALNDNMSFSMTGPIPGVTPISYPGVTPWTAAHGAAIAQSGTYAYATGNGALAAQSMMVTPNGSTATPGAVSEHVTVTGSSTYTASAWFYSPGGWSTGAQVTIAWYTSGGTLISTSTATAVAVTAATWTQASITATAPSNAATGVLGVQFAGTPTATPYYVAEAALVSGSSVVSTGLVTTGTPVRVRFALTTLGGVTSNRWYVIQRNVLSFPEQRTGAYTSYVPAKLTDIWSATTRPCTTPYRGEVLQDNPYAWWPCDDQPRVAGVLPVTLLNAAPANSNVLNVSVSALGGIGQDVLSTSGVSTFAGGQHANVPPSMPLYTVGALSGWMPGDPQATSAVAAGGAETANPGSAAWQATGQAGSTGSYGWYLICNDVNFPPLSGGVTIKGWYNYNFLGSGTAYVNPSNNTDIKPLQQQPLTSLTLWEIATASNPVAILQLNSSGHLVFITYNGSTPTSTTIYSSSDLRSNSWNHYAVSMTTTGWTVYVNGGATAQVSGTATGITSAWTWFLANCDFGSGGGTSTSSIVHGGNVAISHLAIYPSVLPAYRIRSHYWAAICGFGQIPAPTSLAVTWSPDQPLTIGTTGSIYSPDGSGTGWNFPSASGTAASAVAVAAMPGGVTSGPSAWETGTGVNINTTSSTYDYMSLWVGYTALAPVVDIYTSSSTGAEKQASTVCGSGDTYTSGYGSSAVATGTGHTGSGSGASPPTTASSIGDTIQQRLERIFGYGGVTYPRCIDPAPLLTQAALDIGGQAAGTNAQNIAQSDCGMLYVDNLGLPCYRQRPHLAGDTVAWSIGPGTGITYGSDQAWQNDPVRSFTDVRVTQYSPSGAALPVTTPTSYSAVLAALNQMGDRPYTPTSYLQSATEIQSMTNWVFDQYGVVRRRCQPLTADAAKRPSAWQLVAGVNISDLATIADQPFGAPATVGTYRVSNISRTFSGGAVNSGFKAEVSLMLDSVPTSYWT